MPRLLALFAGVLAGAVGMSTCQESVFRTPGFKLSNLVTLGCTLTYAALAATHSLMAGNGLARRGKATDYAALACLTSGGMFFTNKAMLHVTYAARIMCKSCKVVPVMLVAAVFGNAKPTVREVACGIIMTFGVTAFLTGDARATAKQGWGNMPLGISLLLLGLACDATAVNFEERRFFRTQQPIPPPEVAMYSSIVGSGITLGVMAVQDELGDAVRYAHANPTTVGKIVLSGAFGYLSLACVLLLVRDFGATNSEVVKTMRKFLQTALSFLIFPRPVEALHLVGGTAVLAATIALYGAKSPQAKVDDALARGASPL